MTGCQGPAGRLQRFRSLTRDGRGKTKVRTKGDGQGRAWEAGKEEGIKNQRIPMSSWLRIRSREDSPVLCVRGGNAHTTETLGLNRVSIGPESADPSQRSRWGACVHCKCQTFSSENQGLLLMLANPLRVDVISGGKLVE